jgi:hypothetical protein
MILAFLRAESDSPRWQAWITQALGGDLTPLTEPDMHDDEQNQKRRHALSYRGYGLDNYIFKGFPTDVQWYVATVTRDELGGFRYLNYVTFIQLSNRSRLIRDGAANLDVVTAGEGLNDRIRSLRDAVAAGQRFPELIAVAHAQTVPPAHQQGESGYLSGPRFRPAALIPRCSERDRTHIFRDTRRCVLPPPRAQMLRNTAVGERAGMSPDDYATGDFCAPAESLRKSMASENRPNQQEDQL